MTQQDYRSIGYSSYRSGAFSDPEYFSEPVRDEILDRWSQGTKEMARQLEHQPYVRKLEEELAWARFEIAQLKEQIKIVSRA